MKLHSLAVLGLTALILWTARIIFVTMIGDHWIGTLGVTSSILGILIYLSRKGRLGWYSKYFNLWLDKVSGKRVTWFVIISTGFSIYFFGSIITGILSPQPETILQIQADIQAQAGSTNPEDIQRQALENLKQLPWWSIPVGMAVVVLLPVLDFTFWSGLVSVTDDVFHGWLFVFSQVMLVEQLEILGLLFWNRHMKRKGLPNVPAN